jgi:RNA polymerase sigma factor (sigma-70 family)
VTDEQRKLVEDHINIAYYVANKLKHPKFEPEDVCQIALESLCKAAMKYDEGLGVKFSTFAVTVIRNDILMAFKKSNAEKRSAAVLSLDATIFADEDVPLYEIIPCPIDYIEKAEDRMIAKEAYRIGMNSLQHPHYREMLARQLGGESQNSIARTMGFSKWTVSRVIVGAMREIREVMA